MNLHDSIPSVAIVGGGTAGWMAAAALANAFKARCKIQLIELSDDPVLHSAEGSLPSIREFNKSLGLDEDELMRKTQATFMLGAAFKDWSGPGYSFFHPFGHFGTNIESVGFHHCWLKLRQTGEESDLAGYSLASMAAARGRFSRPSSDMRSVLSSYSYALHLDTNLYADLLREYALERGVTTIERKIAEVQLRSSDGFVEALGVVGGEHIRADLFIDCTPDGTLIAEALETTYVDWRHWLPCDRLLSVVSRAAGSLSPFTLVTAHEAGWRSRIPLQHQTSHRYVYSSRFVADDAAAIDLLAGLDTPELSRPALEAFANGRRKSFWVRNCVALGQAAGFLEPLEFTPLHLIQFGIQRLIELLPGGAPEPVAAAEFDRLMTLEFEQIRDYLILHYKMTPRADPPFWSHCRDMDIPESLRYRIELFQRRARVALSKGETFGHADWLAVYIGLGVWPQRYHPFADAFETEDLASRLRTLEAVVGQAAEFLPLHGDYIAKHCRSSNLPVN
jgi:tryptophan halogenase